MQSVRSVQFHNPDNGERVDMKLLPLLFAATKLEFASINVHSRSSCTGPFTMSACMIAHSVITRPLLSKNSTSEVMFSTFVRWRRQRTPGARNYINGFIPVQVRYGRPESRWRTVQNYTIILLCRGQYQTVIFTLCVNSEVWVGLLFDPSRQIP